MRPFLETATITNVSGSVPGDGALTPKTLTCARWKTHPIIPIIAALYADR
jgi:hypothetical protein